VKIVDHGMHNKRSAILCVKLYIVCRVRALKPFSSINSYFAPGRDAKYCECDEYDCLSVYPLP